MDIQISGFYQFFPLSDAQVAAHETGLIEDAQGLDLMGLFILGPEGINSTYAGPIKDVEAYKARLQKRFNREFVFKDSFADKNPFYELKVKVRQEIVTLGTPDLVPKEKNHHHLSPEEWHKALQEDHTVCIDTRNAYETEVGMFKGAIDPKIDEFTEFPDYIKDSGMEKDKKVLIYCTGGIRCEKAILEMERQGYHNVYQLDGGVLNYLKKFPNQAWDGECFVFDYRVAVDQELNPTKKFRLCVQCGDPSSHKAHCLQCDRHDTICKKCLTKGPEFQTCSKNCAHHYRLGHKTSRVHEDAFRKRD